jgi:transcriptional regulator with XRE-family HTH domain
LKWARFESGLTQEQLAKKMKTKQEAIARAENGNVHNFDWVEKAIKKCGFELQFHHISLVKENEISTRFFK